ncbi:MAG: Ig-like domain repeat protein [Chloroflexi bacterium]|nr:Ig-like domain repeat protein [Chloroflexota bacterium]
MSITILFVNGTSVTLAGNDNIITTTLTLDTPDQAAFGSPVTLKARLQDNAGQSVAKATVRFYSPASFLSGAGLMRIGEAVTSEQGVAVIDYVSRRNGQIEIMAEFEGDSSYGPSQAAVSIMVEGNRQLYEAEAGIRVPFISKWFLVAILSAIWGTFFFVALLVLKVASAPPE